MAEHLEPGAVLSHYRILSLLGAGGMGIVYLAEDLSLERRVALKVLSPELIGNEESIRRFRREALTASSLSHPNIIVVHEVGSDHDIHFIATEHIDGETLRQRLSKGAMPIGDAVDVATQICRALAAAHRASLLHRDVKPENIMVRDDGYAKLLDFGLAKVAPLGGLDVTRMQVSTPGTILGTITAMSPEQVRGQTLDERSDLFSLGVVLYEMLAGEPPHGGETAFDVGAAILRHEPPPVATRRSDVPHELGAVVAKLLRKAPAERYQTARDLLADLERLPQLSAQAVPHAPRRVAALGPPSRRSMWMVTILVLAIGGVLWWQSAAERRSSEPRASLASRRTLPVTDSGRAQLVALSPDAATVAIVEGDAVSHRLSLHGVATGATTTLLPLSAVQYWGVAFAADAKSLYFVRAEANQPRRGILYRLPLGGGEPRRLIKGVISPVSVSPDGSHLAFLREDPGPARSALVVTAADGTNERVATTGVAPGLLPDYGPSWSPDGGAIVFARPSASSAGAAALEVVQVKGFASVRVGKKDFFNVRQLVWTGDGKTILVAAQERPTAFAPQIYAVSYPEGDATLLTDQLFSYPSFSIAARTGDVAAIQVRSTSNLWISPVGGSSSPVQVATSLGSQPGRHGVTWMEDNRIVYAGNVGGASLLMSMAADGTDARQLTRDTPGDYDPFSPPGGRHIVFASNRSGQRRIWRIGKDGSEPKELTTGTLDWQPSMHAEGAWVAYAAAYQGRRSIWKVSLDGLDARPLNDASANHPVLSPDGKTVACVYYGSARGDWADRPRERRHHASLATAGDSGLAVDESSLDQRWACGRVCRHQERRVEHRGAATQWGSTRALDALRLAANLPLRFFAGWH